MIPKILNTQKGLIEYSSYGKGIPVLFFHGGHGHCCQTFIHKGFDLRKFHLITPSRPGYGNTPLQLKNSPKETASLFLSLLNELKINKVIVIGISAGAPSAIEFAANFPSRVKKMVLISAVTKLWLTKKDPAYKKGKIIFHPSVERFNWAVLRMSAVLFPKQLAKLMMNELSKVKEVKFNEEEVKEIQCMVRTQRSKMGFVQDLDQEINPSLLNKISCPTLIIHSRNDRSVEVQHAHFAKNQITEAILKTYDNKWGHLIWMGHDSKKPIQDIILFIIKG